MIYKLHKHEGDIMKTVMMIALVLLIGSIVYGGDELTVKQIIQQKQEREFQIEKAKKEKDELEIKIAPFIEQIRKERLERSIVSVKKRYIEKLIDESLNEEQINTKLTPEVIEELRLSAIEIHKQQLECFASHIEKIALKRYQKQLQENKGKERN